MCTKGWDVKAFQAAQQEKDKQIRLVLENILLELKRLHTAQAAQPRNLPDLLVSGTRGGGTLMREHFMDKGTIKRPNP